MKILLNYLKPKILLVVLCVIFLAISAYSSLKLPEYMSRIVNVGVQQSGIEEKAPKFMTQKGYDLLLTFTDEKDINIVTNSYEKVESDSLEVMSLKGKYPGLITENIYVEKALSYEEQSNLESIFETSMETMMMYLQLYKTSIVNPGATNLTDVLGNVSMDYVFNECASDVKSLSQKHIQHLREGSEQISDSLMSSVQTVMTQKYYENAGVNTSVIQQDYISKSGMQMIMITLAGVISTIISVFITAKLSANIEMSLRRDFFAKIQEFGQKEFDKFSVSSLITRQISDIWNIITFMFKGINSIFTAPLVAIFAIVLALKEAANLGWVLFLAISVFCLFTATFFIAITPSSRIYQQQLDKINLFIRQRLEGILVIKAFRAQKYEEEKFNKANSEIRKTSLKLNYLWAIMPCATSLMMNAFTVLILWVSSHQMLTSNLELGSIMAFIQYMAVLLSSTITLSVLFTSLPRAIISLKRVGEVFNTKISVHDSAHTRSMPKYPQKIEFDNVTFGYNKDSRMVLQKMNASISPGEITSIIGRTGSGKSTILRLLLRLYDTEKGKILLNGINIKDISLEELRDKIGYVPQTSSLFKGTLKENLQVGNGKATDEEMISALKASQIYDFFEKKEEGLGYQIESEGNNLSGGQKQRVCLARALIRKADIYILDDCFSAIDAKTELAVRKSIKKLLEGKTVIMVTQKIITAMASDNIIVLKEGEIVGAGQHKALIENCEEYKSIAKTQMKKEKVAYE